MNMAIVPMFLKIIVPIAYKKLSWHGIDLYWRIEMTTCHVVPIVASLTNMIMTQMVFLKRDWRLCLTAGILYIFFNLLGTVNEGHPMYPLVDWVNPSVTIALFVVQSYYLALVHYIAAWIMQHLRHFKEGTGQDVGDKK